MPAGTLFVEEQLYALRSLCREHHVVRLELFGSAARGQAVSESDLDFLVKFETLSPSSRADSYFGLLADLQDLFQRNIDLVEAEAVTNPYFQRAVDADRTVLYAA